MSFIGYARVSTHTGDHILIYLLSSHSRGSSAPGSVPEDTVIMFAIGGYLYSEQINPWEWLTTKEKAEAMADEVATWPGKEKTRNSRSLLPLLVVFIRISIQ